MENVDLKVIILGFLAFIFIFIFMKNFITMLFYNKLDAEIENVIFLSVKGFIYKCTYEFAYKEKKYKLRDKYFGIGKKPKIGYKSFIYINPLNVRKHLSINDMKLNYIFLFIGLILLVLIFI